MSEDTPLQNNLGVNEPNPEEINDFFNDYNPEIESGSASDEKSKNEKIALFGGDLTDIEIFLKHEEERLKFLEFKLKQKDNKLKFLEFKLKKKTLLRETYSSFKDRKNERRLRKENAKKAFWFSSIWAVFIAIFIIIHGLKSFTLPVFPYFEFEFSVNQTEFMFVCGTLTASVLIFYLTVIKNLFPNKPESEQKKEPSE